MGEVNTFQILQYRVFKFVGFFKVALQFGSLPLHLFFKWFVNFVHITQANVAPRGEYKIVGADFFDLG